MVLKLEIAAVRFCVFVGFSTISQKRLFYFRVIWNLKFVYDCIL